MLIIDRIEEETVIIDSGGEIRKMSIKNFALPIKEGDVVIKQNDVYKTDVIATENRRREILEKMKKMGLK